MARRRLVQQLLHVLRPYGRSVDFRKSEFGMERAVPWQISIGGQGNKPELPVAGAVVGSGHQCRAQAYSLMRPGDGKLGDVELLIQHERSEETNSYIAVIDSNPKHSVFLHRGQGCRRQRFTLGDPRKTRIAKNRRSGSLDRREFCQVIETGSANSGHWHPEAG